MNNLFLKENQIFKMSQLNKSKMNKLQLKKKDIKKRKIELLIILKAI